MRRLKLLKKRYGIGAKYKIMFGNKVISTHNSSRVANRRFDKINTAGKRFKKLLKGAI